MSGKTVFVLGAGFTKAFAPNAPLIEDDYDLSRCDAYQLPAMRKIIDAERRRAACNKGAAGRLNIERLLTRAGIVMPYDDPFTAAHQLAILSSDAQRCHIKRIYRGQVGGANSDVLKGLAEHIVANGIDCISFNYDELLDHCLMDVNHPELTEGGVAQNAPRWHPEHGYGFVCPGAAASVLGVPSPPLAKPSMRLLKLNGSFTWRVRLGETQPYRLGAVMSLSSTMYHFSETSRYLRNQGRLPDKAFVEDHLELNPYIVTPTMVRLGLEAQPVLRRVWWEAYHALRNAREVFFVGYSLPASDIAARSLFQEALLDGDPSLGPVRVTVVNRACCEEERVRVTSAYRDVFSDMKDSQFGFEGAHRWAEDMLTSR
jgi:hypothetical protein